MRTLLISMLLAVALAACQEDPYNNPPNMPETPTGPVTARVNDRVQFMSMATDPDGERVSIRIDWGDGAVSEWSALEPGGTAAVRCVSGP